MTTLGDACKFFNGKAHEKDIDENGQFVVVNSKFISTDGRVKKFTKKQMFPLVENDVVMVMSDVPNGKALAKCYLVEQNDKYSLNQRICAIRTNEFDINFLYYQLNRHPYLLSFNNGENQTNLRKGDILNCPLWKPSFEEQKRIVAILDEAFAAIDQAQANIEKNIDNAKELFQSKLNEIFSQKGEGWEEKTFKDVCVLQRGFDLPKRLRVQGDYPLVSSSGIIDSHVESKVSAPGVVTGRSGSIGNLFYIEEDFWPLNTTLYVKDFKGNLEEYVYYFIKQFDLKRFSSGAGVPTLNRNFVHDEIVFSTNSTKVQKKIVTQLNSLNSQAEQIQATYKQKLTNLEDLKKSLLEQAFAGKLTHKDMPA